MVEGCADGGYLANLNLVVDHPRLGANRAESNDRNFTRVQNRGSGVNTEDTDVGDGDGSVFHVSRSRLAIASGCGQLANRLGELKHRHLVGILDVRNNQTARGCRRDAEVHKVVHDDFFIGEGRVDHRVAANRPHHRLGHDQQRSHLDAGKVGRNLQALDVFHGASCVDVDEDAHVRCAECARNHRVGNRLANAFNGDALLALTLRLRC